MNHFIENIEELHTTELGAKRIQANLGLGDLDPVVWCKDKILSPSAQIERRGKNWYITVGRCVITVNAYNSCIITAHKMKDKEKE